ncbi:hypothetical protein LZ31DRAFT_355158 [Colletotrichum somersetense]|nr:hypothetical protein LZ31DRAFT_355158 [Colletotrichum somersetense]
MPQCSALGQVSPLSSTYWGACVCFCFCVTGGAHSATPPKEGPTREGNVREAREGGREGGKNNSHPAERMGGAPMRHIGKKGLRMAKGPCRGLCAAACHPRNTSETGATSRTPLLPALRKLKRCLLQPLC